MPAALHNLGSVRLARGEFPAAEKTLAAALKLKRVVRGADANVASCLNDLGIARKQLGKLKAAEACFEEALGLYAADGDRGDGAARAADVACARINLGNVYMSTGQITGAEACYGAALAAFREIHGATARNADVAKALGNLGVVRDTRGDYAAAAAHHAEALAMQLAVYGGDAANAELANSRENLGHALSHRGGPGDLAAAEAHLAASLAMRRRLVAGQEYPLVRTLGKLAAVSAKRGEPAAAVAHYGAALDLLAAMDGDEPLVAHKTRKIDASLRALLAELGAPSAGG